MSKVRYRKGNPKKYGRDGAWRMSTPSWWVNLQMTRPQRRESKQLAKRVTEMDFDDLIDHPVFPPAKKPHIYFW